MYFCKTYSTGRRSSRPKPLPLVFADCLYRTVYLSISGSESSVSFAMISIFTISPSTRNPSIDHCSSCSTGSDDPSVRSSSSSSRTDPTSTLNSPSARLADRRSGRRRSFQARRSNTGQGRGIFRLSDPSFSSSIVFSGSSDIAVSYAISVEQ